MEARAVALIGRKQRAAKLLYGESDVGLSELTGGDDASDLIAELAKSLDADDEITDLRDLFQAASSAESSRESLWVESPREAAGVAATVVEPEQPVIVDVPPIEDQTDPEPEEVEVVQPEPVREPLPPRPKRKGRRVSLNDVPNTPTPRTPRPVRQPALAGALQQLSLFDV